MIYLRDPDITLYHGDALEILRGLPAESVHCCVTSPPFYGLRNYNVDGQIGFEETPELWVQSLVEVFREVKRVLRVDGTLWLEVGDSYASSSTYNTTNSLHTEHGWKQDAERRPNVRASEGLKSKDLIGAPWLLAFALRADGWYLRSDIIWARPNPMPESVTDRPTKAHSYVFLLAKSPRYFFDQEAVREKASENTHARYAVAQETPKGREGHAGWDETTNGHVFARNIRSVWTIPTQPYPEAHFATFPEELARRCIAAGTSERGCCPECGALWVQEVEQADVARSYPAYDGKDRPNANTIHERRVRAEGGSTLARYATTTVSWRPSCECVYLHPEHSDELQPRRPVPIPCTILDPFVGSGTVPYVARKLGRHAIGIDLSAKYLALAAKRLQQQSLFAEMPT